MQAALDATRVTASGLGGALEALGNFGATITGAHEATLHLEQQLCRLEGLLKRNNQERRALRFRVEELEQQLVEAKQDTELEQRYVRDEQDRFIAALIEDYELQIEQLRQLRVGTELQSWEQAAAPGHQASGQDLELLRKLELLAEERELARELVLRVQQQRDDAQLEQERLFNELERAQAMLREVLNQDDRHSRPTEPPAGDAASPGFSHLAALEPGWDAELAPAPPPSFGAEIDSGPKGFYTSSPPAELRAALTTQSGAKGALEHDREHSVLEDPAGVPHLHGRRIKHSAAPARVSAIGLEGDQSSEAPDVSTNVRVSSMYPDPYRRDDRPPLKRKPDHSLRPLVGYSMRADEIQAEQLTNVGQGPRTGRPR
jgi:hypothetical protein